LFVDLDLQNNNNKREELKVVLCDTLQNIKTHFNGAVPTVLWTGGGYHIYLPLDTDFMPVFEELKDFDVFRKRLSEEELEQQLLSIKFLRYAERKLTIGKSDKNHNPSFRSCMLRIPSSTNSKYQGERAKVKIVQRWNGIRARPTKKFMISDFHVYLVQEVLDEKLKELRMQKRFNSITAKQPTTGEPITISWIEKLLQTPISDYRKHARDLIIIPYLVVSKGLIDSNEICDIVMKWADKCNELKRLEPSRREFSVRIRSRTEEVMRDRIPSMTLETLREKNSELFQSLGLRMKEDNRIK
jgi:hypothetical protein